MRAIQGAGAMIMRNFRARQLVALGIMAVISAGEDIRPIILNFGARF